MNSVYGLLGLNRDILENFALQAHLIEKNVETDRILRKATRKLEAIEDRMQDDGKRPDFNLQSIENAIAKVKRCSRGKSEEWTMREIRIVSYYMINLRDDEKIFDYALKLLDANWRDLYISGLMFFLMNSWNSCADNLLCGVRELIKRHLVNYDGTIKRYLKLKEQIDLLDKAGPARLAALLSVKNISLDDAPGKLGYRDSSLTFPYFSDVIINYFKRKQEIDYNELESVLKKHSLDRTKKLIYAYLVEIAEDNGNIGMQDAVVRSARRILGDINISTTWSPFTGATEDEVWQLNKAKKLVIAWGARKTVDAFFDICVQDPRRRKCWLEYVDNIMDYRIVGSTSVRTKLQSNREVAPLLKTCFIETNSRVSSTAALVLFIKNKVFVEFSDVGSLYIYNSTNKIIYNVERRRYMDSTSDLKDTSIGMAIEKYSQWAYTYYEEGRITHQGEWEERFRRWMRGAMKILPGQKVKNSKPKPTPTPLPTANPFRQAGDSIGEYPQPSGRDRSEVAANVTVESQSLRPGMLVKKEIHGIQSKWIFDEACRIMLDKDGVYLYFKRNGNTYFIAPSKTANLEGYSIWLISSDKSKEKYTVQLVIPNKYTGNPNIRLLGTIERVGDNIAFNPWNAPQVNIYN